MVGLQTQELIVVSIQVVAAIGTVAAAFAWWFAVRHAGRSARASREAILLPAKQEHTKKIRELLDHLLTHRPLGGMDFSPRGPSPNWAVESVVKPLLSSQVLFDDIDRHLSGFRPLWDEMARQLTHYLQDAIDLTDSTAESLEEYFGHRFNDHSGIGIYPNTLSALWRQLYADADSARETFDDLQIQQGDGVFALDRKPPGGGIQRYALLTSSEEIQAVWSKMQSFRSEFPDYDGSSGNLAALRAKYEELEQTRVSIRQLIRDVEPVVIFPEECPLLGIARP